jgi:DNA-3-methyladenine glycosylase
LTTPGFLSLPAPQAAPLLLGWRLRTTIDGVVTEVAITEVEAYGPDDPASHSFPGRRLRNRTMFGPPGHLYVYRSYGVHWCANVVCDREETGAALLLRAGVPLAGDQAMAARRGRPAPLAIGPGNLTRALGINGNHDGLDLFAPESPVVLLPGEPPPGYRVTPRIGITKATERPWRYVVEGSVPANR